jgi:hypothetical protein
MRDIVMNTSKMKTMEHKAKKDAMYGFRINNEKKVFLIKAYGSELTSLFQTYADQLIIRAIENRKIITKHVL